MVSLSIPNIDEISVKLIVNECRRLIAIQAKIELNVISINVKRNDYRNKYKNTHFRWTLDKTILKKMRKRNKGEKKN